MQTTFAYLGRATVFGVMKNEKEQTMTTDAEQDYLDEQDFFAENEFGPILSDDRVFTQHIFNHYDVRPPEVNFEVAETTRGVTIKIEMKYMNLDNWEQAVELYEKVRLLTAGKPEEKDEDQAEA